MSMEYVHYKLQYWVRANKKKIKLFKSILCDKYDLDYTVEHYLKEDEIFLCRNVNGERDKVEIQICASWLKIDREYIEVVKPNGKAYITYVTEELEDSLKLYHYYEVVADGPDGYYIMDDDKDLIYYDSEYLTLIANDDKDNEYELIDILTEGIANIRFHEKDNIENKFMLDKDNRLIIYLPEEISSKCNKKRLVIDLNSICVIDR